tara:strand:- start:895 stop:1407 length:513 start_codon:yes stop_codon:yes gene_type:complete
MNGPLFTDMGEGRWSVRLSKNLRRFVSVYRPITFFDKAKYSVCIPADVWALAPETLKSQYDIGDRRYASPFSRFPVEVSPVGTSREAFISFYQGLSAFNRTPDQMLTARDLTIVFSVYRWFLPSGVSRTDGSTGGTALRLEEVLVHFDTLPNEQPLPGGVNVGSLIKKRT